jgi:hypothetical protein
MRLIQSQPTLASLISFGPVTQNTKYEWAEDTVSPQSFVVASEALDVITVDDGTGAEVGMILQTRAADDTSLTEQLRVTVVSGNDLTVSRAWGGSAGITIAADQKLIVIGKPINEGTEAGDGGGAEPTLAFNYTQIFEKIAKVSRTSQNGRFYGISEGAINYAVAKKLIEVGYDWNNSMIYGLKTARASDAAPGTMGGVLQYMAGGNVDATGGAISETLLNNGFESIYSDGGQMGRFAILCAPNQARRVSAFNTAGTNPVTQVVQGTAGENVAGRAVTQFRSDLPVGTFNGNVVVDPNFPPDQVAILNLDKIRGVTFAGRGMQEFDATLNGADNVKRRLLGELSLEVKDGQKAHSLLTGLTV